MHDCGFVLPAVTKVVSKDFGSNWPAALKFLEVYQVDAKQQAKMMFAIDQSGEKLENVVAACSRCNLSKGSKSLARSGLSLRKPPRQPGAEELRNMGRKFPPNHLHETWLDFLYWDAELEA